MPRTFGRSYAFNTIKGFDLARVMDLTLPTVFVTVDGLSRTSAAVQWSELVSSRVFDAATVGTIGILFSKRGTAWGFQPIA